MTITIVCEDSSKEDMYIDHIIKNCLGVVDLPMKITLSPNRFHQGVQEGEVLSTNELSYDATESNIRDKEVIEVRDLKINVISRQVWVDGKGCFLTTKEFDLLVFLARNPDRVFAKKDLLKRMWDTELESDIAIVTVYVTRIRRKVERDPKRPEYINTVWGSGYRFRA
jgi:DNA-binding response OmpR family regulator